MNPFPTKPEADMVGYTVWKDDGREIIIPGSVLSAARHISHWFQQQGISKWELMDIQSRPVRISELPCEHPITSTDYIGSRTYEDYMTGGMACVGPVKIIRLRCRKCGKDYELMEPLFNQRLKVIGPAKV